MTFRETFLTQIEAAIPDISVYAFPAPETANLPYFILTRDSENTELSLNKKNPIFYTDAWAISIFANSESEAELLKLRLKKTFGFLFECTWGQFRIITVKHMMTSDLIKIDANDTDEKTVRYDLTFTIKYKLKTEV